jgi:maltooligosyltrehalose trehalohydrolase
MDRGSYPWLRPLGVVPVGPDSLEVRTWAPTAELVSVEVNGVRSTLTPAGYGVFEAQVVGADGDDYALFLDGRGPYADPFSRFQPHGSNGPSRIVDLERFAWADQHWAGLRVSCQVVDPCGHHASS